MGIGRIQGDVLTGHPGQQHGGPLLGEQGEQPFDRQGHPVFPAGDQGEMGKGPQQKASAPRQLQATKIGDSCARSRTAMLPKSV